jgi:hypothetical protein
VASLRLATAHQRASPKEEKPTDFLEYTGLL